MTEDRELGVRLRQQEMVVDLGLRALAATDLPTLFKEGAITAAAGLDADSVSIFRVTSDKRSLHLVASTGTTEYRTARSTIALDAKIPLALVFRENAPLVVGDLSADVRFGGSRFQWDKEAISVIAVPIPSGNGPTGVLSIASKTPLRFKVADLGFAQAIANILALSIERHRLLRQLRNSEELHRNLIEHIADVIVVINMEGRIRFASPATRRVFGREPEEIAGRNIYDFVHPDDRGRARDHLIATWNSTREPETIEFRMLHHDGSYPIVDAVGSTFTDRSGRIVLVVNIRDVTDKRLAEEDLRRTVEHAAREWQETFDSIDSPIFILDDRDVVRRANSAARRLAGKPFSEIIGTTIGDLGPGRFWESISTFLTDARTSSLRGERQIEDSGTGRTWMLAASAFEAAENTPMLVLLARDMTPLVELQESLRRSETMSAMGAIIAGVAHEVRNPLFAISATLDAFDARFGSRDEYRRYAVVLREQLTRMNRLMGDLLDYGTPIKLELADVDPAMILRRAVESCEALAAERDVQPRLEAIPLPMATVDAPRLAQVFTILIENAIQHLPPRGEVRVAPEIAVRADANWLRVRVEDNGPGIRAEDLPRLFQPFFSRRQGGTGLGLSIARRIIEEHGGTMEAANREGGGAVFIVLVPLQPASSPVAPAAQVGQNPEGRA